MERSAALDAVFKPVEPPTTFEETVERLGTAIRLGLLAPGTRLPAERDLADQLQISRSTLRHALTTLVQSGHLISVRGRSGGTFVAESPPLTERGAGTEPLGEAARAPRLVTAMTEVQGQMSELIARIAHPEEVLTRSNQQHRRLVRLLRERDTGRAVGLIREHVEGTEHILAGLFP